MPTRVGDYEILAQLGRGGMGVVYEARRRGEQRVVALKVLQSGELATPEERERFREEIRTAQIVEHPHIVSVEDIGEDAGHAYYTMTAYPGVLAHSLDRFRDPKAAARLVATVARAVHHGHVRGVLHRDLKPANILLDERDQPHVADFGAARDLDGPRLTATGLVVGTPMYMAPEQAIGNDVTTAVDIYGLGVILYELLTGAPPFNGDDPSILRALRDPDRVPTSPRLRTAGLPRALETVCLTCLEKEPGARYRSAEDLADDLERFLRGEPIIARPKSLAQRVWRFSQRHVLAVGAAIATMIVLVGIAATAIGVARTQARELEEDVLGNNQYIAKTLAQYVFSRLVGQIESRLAQIAADPEIGNLLSAFDELGPCRAPDDDSAPLVLHPERDAILEPWLGEIYDTVTLFDHCGTVIAFRSALTPHVANMRMNYGFRNYFTGVLALATRTSSEGASERGVVRGGYVSLAFQSEYDDRYKFGISRLIDRSGRIGVVMATISTSSLWEGAPLPARNDADHTYMLVAPQDRSRSAPAQSPYVVLLHDKLGSRDSYVLDSPTVAAFGRQRVAMADRDFRDPLPGFEGRWLADLAPVGNTGFAMIAETRYDAAIRPSTQLTNRLLWRIGAGVPLWTGVFGLALWRARLRRRSHVPPAAPAPSHERFVFRRSTLALGCGSGRDGPPS